MRLDGPTLTRSDAPSASPILSPTCFSLLGHLGELLHHIRLSSEVFLPMVTCLLAMVPSLVTKCLLLSLSRILRPHRIPEEPVPTLALLGTCSFFAPSSSHLETSRSLYSSIRQTTSCRHTPAWSSTRNALSSFSFAAFGTPRLGILGHSWLAP